MTALHVWLLCLGICAVWGAMLGTGRGTTGVLEYGFYGLLVGFHAALAVVFVVWLSGL